MGKTRESKSREAVAVRHGHVCRLTPSSLGPPVPVTDLAENAHRSHPGAARSPRHDGPTLPSTEVAFEGLGLLFRQAHDR